MQNNTYCKALVVSVLHSSSDCEKYLHIFYLVFFRLMRNVAVFKVVSEGIITFLN